MKLSVKLKQLSEGYQAALRTCLQQGLRASMVPALALGRQSVGLGLETLDLARIHEQALAALEVPGARNGTTRCAEIFFNEANSQIEQTHRAARKSTVHLGRLEEKLAQRTAELAAINRELQRGVARRKVMEETMEKRGNHFKNCLEESLQLQKRLRQLTHRVLATQEDERKTIGRELQDEIAQTLLGINVRLLSLKQEARNHRHGLKSEIATTQRLVARSAKSVRRVAREINR